MTPNPKLRTKFLLRRQLVPSSAESGILNELILLIFFETIKWDLNVLCLAASVNPKLRAISKRVLWPQLCMNRAPQMVTALTKGLPNTRVLGGWHALAKLMFYCCGEATRAPGHFIKSSRFSKTSGRSFLPNKCCDDLLYVSDVCEHRIGEEDLGIYRGVFRDFATSRTRAVLIRRQVLLEKRLRCPYCSVRVWNMTKAKLVPKSAARRLGSPPHDDGSLEYFVCLNRHLFGTCWLLHLSSDEDDYYDDGDTDIIASRLAI